MWQSPKDDTFRWPKGFREAVRVSTKESAAASEEELI